MKIPYYNAVLAVKILRDHMLVFVSLFDRNLNVYTKSEKFRSWRDTGDTIGI